MTSELSEEVVAVVEGPNGTARIFEIMNGRRVEYEVRFDDQTMKCESLGEAYIEAGLKAGKKT